MNFFVVAFKRAANIKKIDNYRFSISFLVLELQFKEAQYQGKKW